MGSGQFVTLTGQGHSTLLSDTPKSVSGGVERGGSSRATAVLVNAPCTCGEGVHSAGTDADDTSASGASNEASSKRSTDDGGTGHNRADPTNGGDRREGAGNIIGIGFAHPSQGIAGTSLAFGRSLTVCVLPHSGQRSEVDAFVVPRPEACRIRQMCWAAARVAIWFVSDHLGWVSGDELTV